MFYSQANNLIPDDPTATNDVFLRDMQSGSVSLVSSTAAGENIDAGSVFPRISPNGKVVSFLSKGLDPNDTNNFSGIYVKELSSGNIERIDIGLGNTHANNNARHSDLSEDGSIVVFDTRANNLVPGGVDTNNANDIYMHNRNTGVTQLISKNLSLIHI